MKKNYPGTIEEFEDDFIDKYFNVTVILTTDDLSLVVRGHLLVEYLIDVILKKPLVNDKILEDRSFTYFHKIELLYSQGKINKSHFAALQVLAEIRNAFAHSLSARLSSLSAFTDKLVEFLGEAIPATKAILEPHGDNCRLTYGLAVASLLGFLSSKAFEASPDEEQRPGPFKIH